MDRELDHLVYGVLDLEESIDYIYSKTGVRASIGGRHLEQGTKNALIRLGERSYLELLAIDHDNRNFKGDRWMGIDSIGSPKITRWAVHSKDLDRESLLLQNHNPNLGEIIQGKRQKESGETLQWKMTKPLSYPSVELIPFMIDWSESSSHPCDGLETGCSLAGLHFFEKEGSKDNALFQMIVSNYSLFQADRVRIQARIVGPRGVITL